MAMIPFIGLIGSFVAFLPIIGMFTHWVLFFLMVFFIFVVLNAPTYIQIKILKLFILNTKMIKQLIISILKRGWDIIPNKIASK